MKRRLSSWLEKIARSLDKASGHRLRQNNLLRKIYYHSAARLEGGREVHDTNYEFHSFDGFKLELDVNETHQRRILDDYEKEFQKLFMEKLSEEVVFYDVGANIGYYTLLAAANCPEGRIYSFEPDPDAFAHLERNVSLNDFGDCVTAIQTAVHRSDGKEKLYQSKTENKATHALRQTKHHKPTPLTVPAIRLDTFAEEHPEPDVVKVDVEGTEAAVLESMEGLLGGDFDLFLEVHPIAHVNNSVEEIYKTVKEHGTVYICEPEEKKFAEISDLRSQPEYVKHLLIES